MKNSYILLGQIATAYYFVFFGVLVPVIGLVESFLAHHKQT